MLAARRKEMTCKSMEKTVVCWQKIIKLEKMIVAAKDNYRLVAHNNMVPCAQTLIGLPFGRVPVQNSNSVLECSRNGHQK
jgi:hypothetical protein